MSMNNGFILVFKTKSHLQVHLLKGDKAWFNR